MNKATLISEIAQKTDMTKKDVEAVVNTMLETIIDTLKGGEKVQLSGFGVFEAKARAARIGRNPRTKEAIDIPARSVPSFKPGKGMSDAFK